MHKTSLEPPESQGLEAPRPSDRGEGMLDFFAVFTTGGIILWASTSPLPPSYRSIIDQIMQAVIIDGTIMETFMVLETFRLHWLCDYELGLVYLVV